MENNEELIYLIAALVGTTGYYFYKYKDEKSKRDKVIRENSRLLADNAKMEADDLKFQLQPHTLNNILASLKVLSNKLNRGMDSLSGILEYILYYGNTHFVSVADEIKYIRLYLGLNDLFINQIDSIKFDDSDVNKQSLLYNAKCMPHLVTAYFIENAFKHGDVNHPDFLKVKLYLDDRKFSINVTNKIKNRPSDNHKGLGLTNMKKRLDLLMPGKAELINQSNDQEYIASLVLQLK
jgi:LytS/YehU family sensor histidine kinase